MDATTEQAAADFSLVVDDPFYRAQQTLGLIPRRGGFALGRRIAIVIALTWLPLVVYAFVQRRLVVGGEAPEPLLEHFGVHARFLLALPLLLVAESTMQGTLHRILPQFVTSGLVDEALTPAFRAILADAARLRSSRIALGVMVVLIAVGTTLTWLHSGDLHELSWEPATDRTAFGVLWFSFVARPLFLLALAAWAWRLVVLFRMFAQIAKLDLRLAPTHPDRAAGLGFLEALTAGLAPIGFAVAVPIAGRWAHDAVYHGVDVHTLQAPAIAFVVVQVGIALTPLLAFAPRLRALRRESLAGYGALLAEYGRRVERRWLRREVVADEEGLLSAPELGPVADTVSLYQAVASMRAAPIGRRSLLPVAIASVVPMIPVFAIQIPLKQILTKLLTPMLGI
jgi:hypothetical protein